MNEVRYQPHKNEFLGYVDGEEAGYLSYTLISEHIWDITHTVVFPNYRGKGLARDLVNAIIQEAKQQNITLTASCDYAANILA